MSKLKFFLKESWLLLACSFFFGLLLAVTNAAWMPKIEQNKQADVNHLMVSLLPQAQNFEPAADVEIDHGKGKKTSCRIYKGVSSEGQGVGFCFNAEASGFADKIQMLIAVDKDCTKIEGLNFVFINETPGFGDNAKQPYFRDQFTGAPAAKLNLAKTGDEKKIDSEIIAITGATVTSTAVVNGASVYIEQVRKTLIEKGLIQNVR